LVWPLLITKVFSRAIKYLNMSKLILFSRCSSPHPFLLHSLSPSLLFWDIDPRVLLLLFPTRPCMCSLGDSTAVISLGPPFMIILRNHFLCSVLGSGKPGFPVTTFLGSLSFVSSLDHIVWKGFYFAFMLVL
jgi:hypothetical protein